MSSDNFTTGFIKLLGAKHLKQGYVLRYRESIVASLLLRITVVLALCNTESAKEYFFLIENFFNEL